MTTQELAQRILEMIEETEKSLHNKPDQLFLITLDVDTLQSLKNDIKELCQEEVSKQITGTTLFAGITYRAVFNCAKCGKELNIARDDPQCIQSGIFCYDGCTEQYFIMWNEGILKRVIKEQQIQ